MDDPTASRTQSFPLSGQGQLPVRLAVVPRAEKDASILVRATGLLGPTEVVQQSTHVSFVAGSSKLLSISLSAKLASGALGAVRSSADSDQSMSCYGGWGWMGCTAKDVAGIVAGCSSTRSTFLRALRDTVVLTLLCQILPSPSLLRALSASSLLSQIRRLSSFVARRGQGSSRRAGSVRI